MLFTRTFLFSFCLIHFAVGQSQNLSTYFIDSLKIIINRDTLINETKPKIYFLNNTRDTGLVVFQNSTYNLKLNFQFSTAFYQLQEGWPMLYKNNQLMRVIQEDNTNEGEICDMIVGKKILRNRPLTSDSMENLLVRVSFRASFLAPQDTINYKKTLRQGLWIGRYKINQKDFDAVLYVNYKNDLKHGPAKLVWNDGGYFETVFENGKRLGEGHFNLNESTPKKFKKRPIPLIMFDTCDQ